MLTTFKEQLTKSIFQFIDVDKTNDKILDSGEALFSLKDFTYLYEIHPFFESILDLIKEDNKEFNFTCVHLEIKGKTLITDVIIKTFNAKSPTLVVIQDLTKHYKDSQKITQTRNESVINSQLLSIKNEDLKQRETFKNKFITNFSKMLRDPLTGIITFTDILGKTNLNKTQEDYVNLIEESSKQLSYIINDIVDISLIEIGKIQLAEITFSLHDLLSEIELAAKIKLQGKSVVFETKLDDRMPQYIIGDKYRLKQIIDNIVDNAIKFTDSGKILFNISLNYVRAKKASIHFEIKDTGIGFNEEDKDRIFDSFTKLSNNPSLDKGVGLGLTLVKRLITLKNGNISVESKINEGASFNFNINYPIDYTVKKKNIPKNLQDINENRTKYNILLVEDSEITQLSVLKILASQKNYFLDIVNKGSDVVTKILDQKFDLILMDIEIPNVKGDEVAKIIRNLPIKEVKNVPIIAITANVFKEDKIRYKKAGINSILEKPFNEKLLLERIKKYLKN